MLVVLRQTGILFFLLALLTGFAYPFLVYFFGKIFFENQAKGSLVALQEHLVGSALIGQSFTDQRYFWGRPSATAYQPLASTGSNLSPTNLDLKKTMLQRLELLQKTHPEQRGLVPMDLVAASASGIDPHISVAAAHYQIVRVARARNILHPKIEDLVNEYTENRQWGLFGEPRVHVLKLNLALDKLSYER